jgi:hypothetical protein
MVNEVLAGLDAEFAAVYSGTVVPQSTEHTSHPNVGSNIASERNRIFPSSGSLTNYL